MILQQRMAAPIWGVEDAGTKVTVEFAGQRHETVATEDGRWQVRLNPLKASAIPGELTITGTNRVVIHDVLVGDVWLASGQSNMTMRFDPAFYPAEAAAADQPEIRIANVGPAAALAPQDSVPVSWSVCTRRNIGEKFSAVGYFFAKRLHDELHVPVAIIHSSWEGTSAEPWVRREALLADSELHDVAQQQIDDMLRRDEDDAKFLPKMLAWEQKYGAADPGNKGLTAGWAKTSFDASSWKPVTIPADFRAAGLPGGGVVWFRKDVEIPASAAGKQFVLNPGYTVDTVQAYWDGVELRSIVGDPRRYYPHGQGFLVPGELVKPGRAAVSLRIFGHAEGHLWITTHEMGMPLAEADQKSDAWRCQVETRFPDLPPEGCAALPKVPTAQLQSTAGCLYNGMIRPLIPFAIRGVIWYQGESNVERSGQYAELLSTLIQDWRVQWNEGMFPFYIVQLANLGRPAQGYEWSDWAEVREAQLQVSRNVPNTGLAVTIDIGEEQNIHPRNKRDVGYRLALNALAKTYGRNVEWSGPQYELFDIEGQAIRVRFLHCSGGLQAKGGPLRQFSIAGSDGKFVLADAKIEGDCVVVTSPAVRNPVAVRYAWAKNPAGCNLYNAANLPASPFRTDAWKIVQ